MGTSTAKGEAEVASGETARAEPGLEDPGLEDPWLEDPELENPGHGDFPRLCMPQVLDSRI